MQSLLYKSICKITKVPTNNRTSANSETKFVFSIECSVSNKNSRTLLITRSILF